MSDGVIRGFKPNSKPQELFFASTDYEVLIGGSSGGGKSVALVIDPMRYVDYAGYRSIIFRRTFPELEGSILPLCWLYYPQAGGVYNEQKKMWKFPSGAIIRLGVMEHEEDWRKYQGHQYVHQYYDELTNFTWDQYEGLKPWNRAGVGGIPAYRRASSNPTGISHSQVKEYFIDACPPEKDGPRRWSEEAKVWWQPLKPGQPVVFKVGNQYLSKQYIPARVFDNVDLLRNNPIYLAQLLSMPEHKRKAFLEGDWDIQEGQFFEELHRDIHMMPPDPPDFDYRAYQLSGAIDYGKRTVLEVARRNWEGDIEIFAENYTETNTPSRRAYEMAKKVLIPRKLYKLPIQCDTNMYINMRNYTGYDKTPVSIFEDAFRELMGTDAPVLSKVAKSSVDSKNYRIFANEAFKEYLSYDKDDKNRIVRPPKMYISSSCQMLWKTLPTLISDPNSPDGLDFFDDHGVDDPYDAAKYAFLPLYVPLRLRKKQVYSGEYDFLLKTVFEKKQKLVLSRNNKMQLKKNWTTI